MTRSTIRGWGPARVREMLSLPSGIAMLTRVAGLGASFATVLLVAWAGGAEGLGLFSVTGAVLGISTLVGKRGADRAALRLVSSSTDSGERERLTRAALQIAGPGTLAGGALVGLVLIGADLAGYASGWGVAAWLGIMAGACGGGFKTVLAETSRARERWWRYSVIQFLLVPGITLALAVAVALSPFAGEAFRWIAIGGYLAAGITALGVARLGLEQRERISGSVAAERAQIKEIAAPMWLAGAVTGTVGSLDILVIYLLGGERLTGLYTLARRIAEFSMIGNIPISTRCAPIFAREWSRGHVGLALEEFDRARRMMRIVGGLTAAGCLFWWFGSLAVVGQDFAVAYPIFVVLLIGGLVFNLAGPVGYYLDMTGRERRWRSIIFAGGAVNAVFNVLLFFPFGALGPAIATTLAILIWNGLGAHAVAGDRKRRLVAVPGS